jgi:hypothetical protein
MFRANPTKIVTCSSTSCLAIVLNHTGCMHDRLWDFNVSVTHISSSFKAHNLNKQQYSKPFYPLKLLPCHPPITSCQCNHPPRHHFPASDPLVIRQPHPPALSTQPAVKRTNQVTLPPRELVGPWVTLQISIDEQDTFYHPPTYTHA